MGVRLSSRSFFVLLWVELFVIRVVSAAETICELQGCNCTVKVASWKTINCTLRDVQELKLDLLRIPREAAEIFISGGERIVFSQKSFDQIPGVTLLRIDGTRKLVMEKQSFRNLTTPSLLIQIQNCDDLNIKTGAFENVQSSVEVEITRCASVNVEKTAFSKLRQAVFKEISKLTLATETFELKNQGIIGRHGPVTIIIFDNVTIPTIPYRTFYSTLAEVKILKSTIGQIENEAFSPTQISSLSIIDTGVDHIHNNAFTGRTLIYDFKIAKCNIKKIGAGAITASMANLTVEHSRITDIESGAINSTVVKVDISSNEFGNLQTSSFVFHDWNKISFDDNIVKFLRADFVVAPVNKEVVFSFKGNEVYKSEPGALSFVPQLEKQSFIYKDNFFEQTCHCTFDEWVIELITANITSKVSQIVNNTFCRVNELLSKCFELKVGVINVKNFTDLVCTNNTIVCEPYRGETKIVNSTNTMLTDNDLSMTIDWLAVIIGTSAVLVVIVVITATIMLIKGSRWLKRKGYFRKIQYNQNEHSNDEENTAETVDEGDKLDISEDLTMELLQDLSSKLDDPLTHQEASEMIEQLYQKYIHGVGFENNNQDEDAHLYEELGNLQMANGINHDPNRDQQNGPRSILRLMEERFNTQLEDIDAEEQQRNRPVVGDYSEPSDAAVHLYSEVKHNRDSENENKDSLKSRASSNMAFRPLPDKPGSSKM